MRRRGRERQPARDAHGSFWFYWTTQHEIAWRRNFQRWMAFINEYKNRGGRLCVGTLQSAQLLGRAAEVGTIEVGKRADLVILDENPLANTRALYGTGAIHLNDATGKPERVGGVRTTIVGGAVFDAKALLEDVRRTVDAEKARRAALAP